jgi:hypothetical protein
MNYKLSPSDMTFLYDGCRRCFYQKVRHGITRPSIPIPSIFSKIAGLLKGYYDGKRTEELHPGLPPGIIKYGERYVQSVPLSFEGRRDTCYIKGRFDVVVEFDDGTFGVIDYKTGNPEGEFTSLYGRQLHSYAYALENPASGSLHLTPITKLALLYFHPTSVSQNRPDWLSFDAEINLIAVARDDGSFYTFTSEVMELLESPQPPASSSECEWCKYIDRFR